MRDTRDDSPRSSVCLRTQDNFQEEHAAGIRSNVGVSLRPGTAALSRRTVMRHWRIGSLGASVGERCCAYRLKGAR